MVENKYYERKIKYLDLMKNGERVGGAGFIKTEVRGMDISLAITVKGLHPTDTYERDVLLQAGDSEFAVGRIALKEGQGQFKYHTVMDYSQLQGIRIALGGVREIRCKWHEEKKFSAVKSSTAENDMEQDNEESGGAAGQMKEEKQYKSAKAQEIQVIPWDEIKAVEESLERTEKLMSKPAENGRYEAAEKAVKRAMAKGTSERRASERGASGKETSERGTSERGTSERGASGKETSERWASGKETSERWASGKETSERWASERWASERGTSERGASGKETSERWASERGTSERGASGKETSERWALEKGLAERGMSEKGTSEGGPEEEAAAETMTEKKAAGRETPIEYTTEKEIAAKGTTKEIISGEMSGKSRRAIGNSIKQGERTLNSENAAAGRSTDRRAERLVQRPMTGSSSGHEKRPVRLMEDKWQQIWAIYPHIRPFQDEREYLSISPADFVLLPGDAYRAANNSFLLHGYYNYDHLILTKLEKRGEVSYYIGVPGNYYEREKQVAIMFGFESFECGTEPAQAGDFGYYMMKTQL